MVKMYWLSVLVATSFAWGMPKKGAQHKKSDSFDIDVLMREQVSGAAAERAAITRAIGRQNFEHFLADYKLQTLFVDACLEYGALLAERVRFYRALPARYGADATISFSQQGCLAIRAPLCDGALSETELTVVNLFLTNFKYDMACCGYMAEKLTEQEFAVVERFLSEKSLSFAARRCLMLLHDLHVWDTLTRNLERVGFLISGLQDIIQKLTARAHHLHTGIPIIRKIQAVALRWKLDSRHDGEKPTLRDVTFARDIAALGAEFKCSDSHRVAGMVRIMHEEVPVARTVHALDLHEEQATVDQEIRAQIGAQAAASSESIDIPEPVSPSVTIAEQCTSIAQNRACWHPRVTQWFDDSEGALVRKERACDRVFGERERRRVICHHRFDRGIEQYIPELGIIIPGEKADTWSVNIPGEMEYADGTKDIGIFSWGINIQEGVCYHRSFAKRIYGEIQELVQKRIYNAQYPPLSTCTGIDKGLWYELPGDVTIRLYKTGN